MSFQGSKSNTQDRDMQVPQPPSDGISDLAVNGSEQQPTSMLLATSWDGTVSCYEVQQAPNGMVQNVIPQTQLKHDAPALCCDIAQVQNCVNFLYVYVFLRR